MSTVTTEKSAIFFVPWLGNQGEVLFHKFFFSTKRVLSNFYGGKNKKWNNIFKFILIIS